VTVSRQTLVALSWPLTQGSLPLLSPGSAGEPGPRCLCLLGEGGLSPATGGGSGAGAATWLRGGGEEEGSGPGPAGLRASHGGFWELQRLLVRALGSRSTHGCRPMGNPRLPFLGSGLNPVSPDQPHTPMGQHQLAQGPFSFFFFNYYYYYSFLSNPPGRGRGIPL